MVDVTYEDYQDLVRKLSLANERVRDLQERVSGRDARIAALEAKLLAERVKVPADELTRYINRCREMSENGKYSWWSRLAEILSALEAAPPAPMVTEAMVQAAWARASEMSVGTAMANKSALREVLKAALTAAQEAGQ